MLGEPPLQVLVSPEVRGPGVGEDGVRREIQGRFCEVRPTKEFAALFYEAEIERQAGEALWRP